MNDLDKEFKLLKSKLPKAPKFVSAQNIIFNYSPHPFCITPEHMKYAHMFIHEASITEAENAGVKCGMYSNKKGYWRNGLDIKQGFTTRCNLKHSEHKTHKILVIRIPDLEKPNPLVRDVKGLNDWLKTIQPILTEHKLDGVVFTKI